MASGSNWNKVLHGRKTLKGILTKEEWNEIRKEFRENFRITEKGKVKLFNEMNTLLKNSKLTEDDALELGMKLKQKAAFKFSTKP